MCLPDEVGTLLPGETGGNEQDSGGSAGEGGLELDFIDDKVLVENG